MYQEINCFCAQGVWGSETITEQKDGSYRCAFCAVTEAQKLDAQIHVYNQHPSHLREVQN